LKVDQSFVRDMETKASNMAILLSIIELGGALDIKVTVEGVEAVSDASEYANEISEVALAHVVGDETERAYRRGAMRNRSI
jgi:predicted signal transduction protein with EAL and GGDEF domain